MISQYSEDRLCAYHILMKSKSKQFREKVQNAGVNAKFESKIGAAILAKYGWKEGDSLGKQGEGIVKPVSLSAVKNNKGLGSKDADPWHNWWDDMYNDLAKKSVKVKSVKPKLSKVKKKDKEKSKTKKSLIEICKDRVAANGDDTTVRSSLRNEHSESELSSDYPTDEEHSTEKK
uniref:G-patch domain containing protein n=1 Tax=Babesia bovis TaxID=5865 RepID=S6C9B9_BABBO|nr:G-patch domain containing protein [Babesia bovis]